MKTLAAPIPLVLSALALAVILVLTGCTADSLTGPDLLSTVEASVEIDISTPVPYTLFDASLEETHNEGKNLVGGDERNLGGDERNLGGDERNLGGDERNLGGDERN